MIHEDLKSAKMNHKIVESEHKHSVIEAPTRFGRFARHAEHVLAGQDDTQTSIGKLAQWLLSAISNKAKLAEDGPQADGGTRLEGPQKPTLREVIGHGPTDPKKGEREELNAEIKWLEEHGVKVQQRPAVYRDPSPEQRREWESLGGGDVDLMAMANAKPARTEHKVYQEIIQKCGVDLHELGVSDMKSIDTMPDLGKAMQSGTSKALSSIQCTKR